MQALQNSGAAPVRQRTVRRQLESQQDWNTATHRVYPGTPVKKTEGDDHRQQSAYTMGEGGQYFSQKGGPDMFNWNTAPQYKE